MKARVWIGLTAVAVLVAGGYIISRGFSGNEDAEYTLTEIKIGDVKTTVSATGALSPVTSVEVGVTSEPDRFWLRFNRPFFCAIRDDSTGVVLFAGTINTPE